MKKNFLYSLLTTSSRVISGFFLLFILARELDLSDFGLLTYSMVFSNMLVLIVEYGYNIKLSKDSAKNQEKISELVYSASIVKLVLLLPYLLIIATLYFIGFWDIETTNILVLMFVSVVFNSFANFFLIPYKSVNRFDKESIYVAANNILIFILSIAVAYTTKNIFHIAIVFIFVKFIFLVATFLDFKNYFGFTKYNFKFIDEFKSAFPYAIHIAIGAVYLNIDTIFLKEYTTLEDVAVYQGGMRLLGAATILLTVINSILIPRLSHSFTHNKNDFDKNANISNILATSIGLGCLIIFGLFPEFIVNLVYGEKFIELEEYLFVFGAIIFLRYFGVVHGTMLTISENQKTRTFAVSFTLIFIVIFDMIFIPKYGIEGAQGVLLAAHILLGSIYMFFTYKSFGSIFLNPKYIFRK